MVIIPPHINIHHLSIDNQQLFLKKMKVSLDFYLEKWQYTIVNMKLGNGDGRIKEDIKVYSGIWNDAKATFRQVQSHYRLHLDFTSARRTPQIYRRADTQGGEAFSQSRK